LRELKQLANPQVRAKMAYFGVNVPKAHGISQPVLHALARRIGKNHKLAEQLWLSEIHEARILATLIGEAEKVTAGQMERWARKFDSWDVVDAACCYLYAGAAPAWRQVEAWSRRREEFVKRAAFSLVAYLSYKDKQASDARFERFLRVIEREARDGRNFRAQSGELGATEYREEKLAPESIGDSRSGAHSQAGFAIGALDCRGRSARTAKRGSTEATVTKGRVKRWRRRQRQPQRRK